MGTRLAEVYIRVTYTALYYAKPSTSEVTNDEFNTGSLDGMWTQDFKTNGGYDFDVDTEGTICLTAGESTFADPNGIYQSNITGDFSIDTHIVSWTVESSTTSYGLIVYIDSTHYFSIGVAANGYSYYRYAIGEIISYNRNLSLASYFRFVRVGSNVSAYRSTNGSTWTSTYGTVGIGSGDCRIYLCAVTGAGVTGKKVEFDWIRNSAVTQTPISIYKDNTGMSHYLAMRTGGETLYALASTVGEANESAIRVRIDGTTYSIKTQR